MIVSLLMAASTKPVPAAQDVDSWVAIVGIIGSIVFLLAICTTDKGGK
ncbi:MULTISPECIES: hypothetical protein [Pelosinus]|uniref:Uncharacterized protein n=1 Tax=Pelosinus fermentans B4 TaxID=1149862 RepID=I9B499_9FIRM|nr:MULTISPECIES: hypothetical protein [Pelosinus]EIW19957.1 hypothetical protein FB4_0208 [Pelosinus fermentans B4]EIW21186.1 hypothetical protein FA11_0913 [Pelosinus fermentans A11]